MKQKEKTFAFRGKYFVLLVLVLYFLVFLFDGQAGVAALQKSGRILLKILPIISLVILFTAVLNYTLKPVQLVKHLGEQGAFKGCSAALLAGIISHGPMYLWYPMIQDMRKSGLKDSLVVTFFYARAIKLPLLPLMIDYFGLVFTIILSFYILVGALLQGWIFDRLNH